MIPVTFTELGKAALQLATKKLMVWLSKQIDDPVEGLPDKDLVHQHQQIHDATTGNKCCICGARGGTISKYLPLGVYSSDQQGKELARALLEMYKTNPPTTAIMPITWRCVVCTEYVCFNCTLIVPNSNPLQFYEDTYCSDECRKTTHHCKECDQPKECVIDSRPDERGEELWSCVNENCPADKTAVTA